MRKTKTIYKEQNYFLMLILISIMVVTFGCAKSIQAYQLPDKQSEPLPAKIYVFRPSIGAYAINLNIYENRNLVGYVGPRGYLAWETKKDTVLLDCEGGFSASRSLDFVKIEAKPGKTYYFELKPRLNIRFDYSLTEISEKEAIKYLSKLKPPKVKIVS